MKHNKRIYITSLSQTFHFIGIVTYNINLFTTKFQLRKHNFGCVVCLFCITVEVVRKQHLDSLNKKITKLMNFIKTI